MSTGETPRITPTSEERAMMGEPQPHELLRDGDRPLAFTGWLLGEGDDKAYRAGHSGNECDVNRWAEVAIYLTVGGSLVVQRGHRSRWQGERDHDVALVCQTPEDALAWLRDEEGTLGDASRVAWENACGFISALEQARVESIP